MNKAFLLLRKNAQTGPFTFDELMLQKLVPTDLIWIEGESTAWLNPDELQHILKNNRNKKQAGEGEKNKKEVGKKTNEKEKVAGATSPGMEIEQRAEALRKSILAQASAAPKHQKTIVEKTSERSRTIYITDDNVEFTYRKAGNKVTAAQLLMAAMIAAFVFAITYTDWSPVNTKKHDVSGVATPAVAGTESYESQQTEALPAVQMETTAVAVIDSPLAPALNVAPVIKMAKSKESLPKPKTEISNIQSQVAAQPEEKSEMEITTAALPETETETEAPPKEEIKKEIETVTEAPERKKSLGQVIKGIFKKKNKGEAKEEGVEATDGE